MTIPRIVLILIIGIRFNHLIYLGYFCSFRGIYCSNCTITVLDLNIKQDKVLITLNIQKPASVDKLILIAKKAPDKS